MAKNLGPLLLGAAVVGGGAYLLMRGSKSGKTRAERFADKLIELGEQDGQVLSASDKALLRAAMIAMFEERPIPDATFECAMAAATFQEFLACAPPEFAQRARLQ